MMGIEPEGLSASALGLIALLGLRHGLDPDHVAVIDNMTFQAVEERPRLAPWVGTLFALGHSLSVAVVAVGVSLFAARLRWPGWAAEAADWAVIGLLLAVGLLNLRALRRPSAYTPVGWRQALLPSALRGSSHPAAIVAVGVVFGLVFDTATQAAAWGLAAGAAQGVQGALLVAGAFAVGMIAADSADSIVVARLLRSGAEPARVARYRRNVGWVIVSLSFGMAGYALLAKANAAAALPDPLFTAVGVAMALSVVVTLLVARARRADAARLA